ncbi:hypothetical protein E6W39_19760 [Kitasatospora acidiphila]|uniref:Uncharacterized protein n=1 Tax=Kitasatospora acidiphila TaxID=2567942 RepID=A0A540W4U8_9ACTN|nr:hypothetical protein [Kitasatospora acidiphila]TQF04059.1 hypothetical protein E6W39_19760 [Kitasatospora acidiphila]
MRSARGSAAEVHLRRAGPAARTDLSSYAFKDEEEYVHSRRLGFITDAERRLVEQPRQRTLGLLQDRAAPFAGPVARLRAG